MAVQYSIWIQTYPVASTVALFLINQLKFAKFQRVKTKALSKRLFQYVIPTHPSQFTSVNCNIGMRMLQK